MTRKREWLAPTNISVAIVMNPVGDVSLSPVYHWKVAAMQIMQLLLDNP
jgi:hypothetical protein